MRAKNIQQFVIYSRKSKFTGKGESIENQIEMCRQYIETHYSKEEADAARVYEDAPVIIGLKQNPTQMGAALVLFSLFTGIFENFR